MNANEEPPSFTAEAMFASGIPAASKAIACASLDTTGVPFVSFSLRGPKGGYQALDWFSPAEARVIANLLLDAANWCDGRR